MPEIDAQGLRRCEEHGQVVAAAIDEITPPGWGFAVLWFQFSDEPGAGSSYVTNIDRGDLARSLREMADVLDAKSDSAPGILANPDVS